MSITISDYLSRAYAAHHRLSKETMPQVVAELKAKMATSPGIRTGAEAERARLQGVQAALAGNELRQRCVISATYLDFLNEVLG